MFNSVKLSFPNSQYQAQRVWKAIHREEIYTHDYATVTIKDWKVSPTQIKPGTPVVLSISGKDYHGYVHDVSGHMEGAQNYTEIGIIGASYVMRQSSQKLYTNTTADQVIVDIAKRYGFAYRVTPHTRVHKQLAQAGASDWEFMVRLAKQCGYLLRAVGAVIYFHPMLEDFNNNIYEAPKFTKVEQGIKVGNPIYYFKPNIGETLAHFGVSKSATSVAGVDPNGNYSGSLVKYTNQDTAVTTRYSSHPEIFDSNSTHTVVNSVSAAAYESEATDARSTFAYTAEVSVIGNTYLAPAMPVYLANLGQDYSGYWTVLATEHHIVEQSLNTYMYTTTATVGTDSLGAIRNRAVPDVPDDARIRNIIPNVKNTRITPSTVLKTNFYNIKQVKTSALVNRTNRPNVSDKFLSKTAWESNDGNLNSVYTETPMPAHVKRKLGMYVP